MKLLSNIIGAALSLMILHPLAQGKTLCHVCIESKGLPIGGFDHARTLISFPSVPSTLFSIPAVRDYARLQVDVCRSWQWSWSYLANNHTFDCDSLGPDVLHLMDPEAEKWACIEFTEWFNQWKTTGQLIRSCYPWNPEKLPNMEMNSCGVVRELKTKGKSDLDVCICDRPACNNLTQAFSSGSSPKGHRVLQLTMLVAGVFNYFR